MLNFELHNNHILSLRNVLNANTTLEDLSISCDPNRSRFLLGLIATNTTLTQLHLQLDTLDDDEFLQRVIANGLEMNSALTTFELRGEVSNRMSYKSQQSFVAMLEKNYTLEYLHIFLSDEDLRSKMKFFLKLNQTGKRKLVQNPDAILTELVDSLAFVSDDLDSLFYFLVNRPCLCKRL